MVVERWLVVEESVRWCFAIGFSSRYSKVSTFG